MIQIEIGNNRNLQVAYDGNIMSKATVVLIDTKIERFPISLTKGEALQLAKALCFLANAIPDEPK
jgi:hypothetical protein